MKTHALTFAMKDFDRWGPFGFSVGIHLVGLIFLPALLVDLSIKNLQKPPVMRFVEIIGKQKIEPPKPAAEPEKPLAREPVKREIKAPEPKTPQIVNEPVPQTASVSEPVAVGLQIPKAQARSLTPPMETSSDMNQSAMIALPTSRSLSSPQTIAALPKPAPAMETSSDMNQSAMIALPASRSLSSPQTIVALPKPAPPQEIDESWNGSRSSALKQVSQTVSLEPSVGRIKPRTIAESFSGFTTAETSRLFAAKSLPYEPFNARPRLPQPISEPDDMKGVEERFASLVRNKIAAVKTYPPYARQREFEGRVQVAFTVARDGRLLNLALEGESGYETLDEAALQAVKDAAPFPPIPEKLERASVFFKLPISFTLR